MSTNDIIFATFKAKHNYILIYLDSMFYNTYCTVDKIINKQTLFIAV